MDAREYDIQSDWDRVLRTSSIVLRYPKTVVGITMVVVGAAWLFTMTRTPSYEATATVRLEDPREKSPALAGYDIPVGITDIEEAMALLDSRDLISSVVAPPSDGAVATPDHPEWPRRMGLATRMDDESLVPLAALTGNRDNGFRAHAWVESTAPDSPRRLRLRFLAEGRVVVSIASELPGVEWPSEDARAFPYAGGERIHYHGVQIRLETTGAPDGRTFLLSHSSPEEATDLVQAGLHVDRAPNQSGVVRLTVQDRDPERAAAIANGLIATYIARDRESVRGRAEEDVAYVREQLVTRTDTLAELDTRIAAWKVRFPDVIDATAAGIDLIERRSGIDSHARDLARLELHLRRMLQALERGDRTQVSRMGPALDDLFTRRLLDQIATFEDERSRLGRAESGEFHNARKILLEQKRDAFDELAIRSEMFDRVLAQLEAGNASTLGLLGDQYARDGSVTVDEFTHQYLRLLGNMQARLLELEVEYQPDAEIVQNQGRNIAQVVGEILEHLRRQKEALAAELELTRADLERWESEVESYSDDERALIDAALASLWSRVESALVSRLEGVEEESRQTADDLEEVERRLQTLPSAEQGLADLVRRRDVLDEEVRQLLGDSERTALALAGVLDTASILDPATPGRSPIRPIPAFGVAVGLIAGLILALLAAHLHDRFRARPRTELELEAAFGLPLCGVIPVARRGAAPPWRALLEESDAAVAEAYRTLRTRLRAIEAAGHPMRTVAIASCFRGEGRTATNAGLAMAFAMEGSRVLLVDADLRSPGLAEHLDVTGEVGLADVLEGRATWRAGARPTAHENLQFLAAGHAGRSPSDVLGSARMEAMLADALREVDVVVLDLPPVHDLPDVEAVAPFLDALLLAHGPAGPSKATVSTTVRRLRRSGVKLVGIVQNAVVRGPRRLHGAPRRGRRAA